MTTLTCHDGLFRFTRMPLRLKNEPGTFQPAITIILSTVEWKYAFVYFDDIIVFSTSRLDHLDYVREVMGLFQAAGWRFCARNDSLCSIT